MGDFAAGVALAPDRRRSGRLSRQGSRAAISGSPTYNEPLVNIEFVLDCAREVRRSNLKKPWLVTNGSINPEPLAELLPWIDALNIDLKAWDPRFYAKSAAGLNPVWRQSGTAAASACRADNAVDPGARRLGRVNPGLAA
jgi:hypothetical protein